MTGRSPGSKASADMYHDDGLRCPLRPCVSGPSTEKRPPPIRPREHPRTRYAVRTAVPSSDGPEMCAGDLGFRPDRGANPGVVALTGRSVHD